ncbi:glycosyltransferase family 2 protein [Agrobacterium pusense]|uniref:glycosyltransferase family 2 protein n=1 Tax=Agrobacterium pusense TaxID=648995 RepID=UPI002867D9B0|nr:glycosyltransferase family 2 protein [Agrobacterium pusense]WMW58608.1 glycosyltransferase family 2 protein [Agrobacterium pusense]
MELTIRPSRDLSPVNTGDLDLWCSSGDDPFFDIRFKTLRNPVLVVFLRSNDDELVEPKVYVNRGHGYRERDTIQHEPGRSFIITADVGRSGLIKAVRIDPSTQPGEISFSVEAFPDWESAERVITQRLGSDMQGAARWNVGRLPRFRMKLLPSIRLRRAKSEVLNFLNAQSELAGRLPVVRPEPDDAVWLSIVVPVYNAPKRYLDDLVRSFDGQNTDGVELILSDDCSRSDETLRFYNILSKRRNIKVVRSVVNGGIANATNAGLAEASGTWVTLLDHDDVIAPNALKVIAAAIVGNPQCQFLYTDEVVVNDELAPNGLMLKPAFDPVLLTGVNYINHFSVYRHERLRSIGYLRTGFDGSQDYDLLLRYLEGVAEHEVLHIPYPAYWWRRTGQTYSRLFMDSATQAARVGLKERFERENTIVSVGPALTPTLHRIDFQRTDDVWPKISVVIPSRDGYDLIKTVLKGLFDDTDYPDLEVIIVDNGTTDKRVLALYKRYVDAYQGFSAIITEEPFNFARSVNRGLQNASGEHFLVLNNDIEIIEPSWLKEMVSCLKFDAAGIVGAKLLYPNQKIQHAGVIVGFGGLAGHWYLNKPASYGGPMNRLHVRNSVTCVTGAAMLISGDCRREIGQWDEINFAVAYNDVDYCVRAHKAGFRIIWTPFACLYHHESASRGSDLVGEKKRRFEQEKENLRLLHGTETFDDPAINPGYEKMHSTPGLELPARLPRVRQGLRVNRLFRTTRVDNAERQSNKDKQRV